MRILIVMCMVLLVGGCNTQAAMEMLLTPEVLAESKNHIAKLRSRDFAAVESAMAVGLERELSRETLLTMAKLMPPGQPSSIELLAAKRVIDEEKTTYYSVFEYLFGKKSVVISITLEELSGTRRIVGFYVTPQQAPLAEQNAFTFEGKGAVQYTVLAGAVAAMLVSLLALVKCARTNVQERKWLWVVFILVGFGKVSVNWQTGAVDFMPLAVHLLSAGYVETFLSEKIIFFSIPLGALLFLSRYRKGSPVYGDAKASAK